jgi:hypothetical protein
MNPIPVPRPVSKEEDIRRSTNENELFEIIKEEFNSNRTETQRIKEAPMIKLLCKGIQKYVDNKINKELI